MAIIPVSVAADPPTAKAWELPPGPQALRSPIPRGRITFAGTDAIATLVSGNQTQYTLSLTFPTGFVYLPRTLLLRYTSDDLDISWDANAIAFARLGGGVGTAGTVNGISWNLTSPGVSNIQAAVATRVWAPSSGSPKILFLGDDVLQFFLEDMDVAADGATAGDMSYWHDFYVFDVDQVDKWEINTPIPVISHVSF